MHARVGTAALVVYLGSIIAANYLVNHYGLVPVGFGLVAPAGVYAVGVAFTARDVAQEALGRRAIVVAIAAGAVLSLLIAPARLAVASGVAFSVSELADFAVYTPLRERTWLGAVALSNTVGLALDSVLFLMLAFGSLEFVAGQLVGKAYMTAAAVMLLAATRRRWRKAGLAPAL